MHPLLPDPGAYYDTHSTYIFMYLVFRISMTIRASTFCTLVENAITSRRGDGTWRFGRCGKRPRGDGAVIICTYTVGPAEGRRVPTEMSEVPPREPERWASGVPVMFVEISGALEMACRIVVRRTRARRSGRYSTFYGM